MGSELRSAARVTKGDDGLNLSPENADEVVARRLIAEELGTAIDEAKTTLDRVGNAMGCKKQHVSEMCDPRIERTASLRKVVELGLSGVPGMSALAVGLLRRIADRVEREAAQRAIRDGRRPARRDLSDLAMAHAIETGKLTQEVQIARADGRVDHAELLRLEAAAHRSQAQTAAFLAECAEIRNDLNGAR